MLARILMVAILAYLGSSEAVAQVSDLPDLDVSTAGFVNHAGVEACVLLVLPDGSGPDLADARTPTGHPVDARVLLMLRDPLGYPFPGFARDNVWLAPVNETGTLSTCPDAGSFDYHSNYPRSDENGEILWHAPVHAGGWSDTWTTVYVWGDPLRSLGGLRLNFVSPDINGDLKVDLTDAGIFTSDLEAGYHFRSDLVHDGVLNLSDVGVMANSLGADCQ